MSESGRESILRRFSTLLDEAFAREEPPPGIPEELLGEAEPSGGDLYSVQAALTALTQEVKLQGRSFKQLSETVAPVAGMAKTVEFAIAQAQLQARAQVLDLLLDLRDRLLRGEETAAAAASAITGPRRWWQREERGGASNVVAALREGYQLTRARVDEALAGYGVREIDCSGLPFDPRTMHAIEVERTAAVPEGAVVSVLRRGYERNGEIYRPAEVRVARPPEKVE